MIIGYDASRAFIDKKTGTENYAYQLLHNLSLVDHINTYYVYTRKLASKGNAFTGLGDNFKIKVIDMPRLWTQVGLASRTFIDPLDVLFIPSHTLPIIRKPGLKTVLTVHDLGAEFLPGSHQLKQRLYLDYMTHHQLKSATHIIAVSQATKEDIITKTQISRNKITVIHEGYNDALFGHEISFSALKKALLEFNIVPKSYFLFVGTIQPRKNLKRLIQAYSHFCHSRESGNPGSRRTGSRIKYGMTDRIPNLVLAGSKGWLSEEIYALPQKLGIESRVRFLGYVPDDKLPSLYQGAKAFLFPSLFEGFGLPVLEALASSCPVLTSKVSSLPEVGGKAVLYVDPYSVESITKGIIDIQSSTIVKQLSSHTKNHLNQFSWQKAALKTLEVLENV